MVMVGGIYFVVLYVINVIMPVIKWKYIEATKINLTSVDLSKQ